MKTELQGRTDHPSILVKLPDTWLRSRLHAPCSLGDADMNLGESEDTHGSKWASTQLCEGLESIRLKDGDCMAQTEMEGGLQVLLMALWRPCPQLSVTCGLRCWCVQWETCTSAAPFELLNFESHISWTTIAGKSATTSQADVRQLLLSQYRSLGFFSFFKKGEVKGQILSKKEFYLVIRKEKQFRSLKLNLILAKVSDSWLPAFWAFMSVLGYVLSILLWKEEVSPLEASRTPCWGCTACPKPLHLGWEASRGLANGLVNKCPEQRTICFVVLN